MMKISKLRHETEAPTAHPARSPWRKHLRPLLLAGAGSLALAVAGAVPGAGGPAWRPASASEHGQGAGSAQARYCQDFVNHLSSNLGVGSGRTQAAIHRAARQTLNDAVHNGDLTSKQASAVESRMAGRPVCDVDLAGLSHQVSQAARMLVLNAVAKTLGTSPDQVRTQLSQGRSVSEIAPAGMTEQTFTSSLQTNLRSELDAQVSQGNLTPAQENQALSKEPNLAHRLWTQGAQAMQPSASPGASPTAGP